ncbi:hypothetical protein GQ457_04G020760 [Hibiscus cannabinus]
MAITLLAQASLPFQFWAYAVSSAAYLINRLPSQVLDGISPYEKLHGIKPDYCFLRVFGCSSQHKGYICMAEDGRVCISRHVVFDESTFPYAMQQAKEVIRDAHHRVTRSIIPIVPGASKLCQPKSSEVVHNRAVNLDNSGNEDIILRSGPESINAGDEDVCPREEEVTAATCREGQVSENASHWREEGVSATPLREDQVIECPGRTECVTVLPESFDGHQQHGLQSVVHREGPSLTEVQTVGEPSEVVVGEQQVVNTHPMLTQSKRGAFKPKVFMEGIEMMVAYSAMAIAKEKEAEEEESQSPRGKWAKWKRRGIIGAAAITGGAVMAITGGLAAPAIAAGFGALAPTLGTLIPVIGASGFAAAASAAGTVAGSVAVAASFGAAGAGLTGSKMARRTGNIDEFEFLAIGDYHNQGRLAVEILISGFVFNKDDYTKPWEGKIDNMERFALLWESDNLIAVSTAIQDWLTSSIALELMRQGAMMTVLSSLVTALALPAVLFSATSFIDSKMTIAVDRSDKAGKLLAEVLLKGYQGNRPVTLIGYSLGARVIFKCLQALSETEQNAELVERVVLLGAPIAIKGENWEAARKMVAGRFINAYSSNDWMLGVAFRASLLTQGLAGIQPVDVQGIENVNVTDEIEGHSSYLWATRKILDRLELETYYPIFKNN